MANKKKFLDVVSISGSSVKAFEGERRYLSTGDLDFNKIDNLEIVTYENKPSRANQTVDVGEVIFAKMKDTKKTLVIDESNKDIIVSTGFYVLKPSKEILSKYLYHYLNSDYFLNQKNKLSKGATQCALNNEGLSNINIYMHKLDKQKKIVEILDKAQELIDKRKEQIEALDELVKSRFIEMFGDPVTNPKGWEKRKLADECNIITGNTPSRKVEAYYGDYIEWIKSDNITNAGVYLTTARECLSEKGLNVGRSVEPNSILMTCIAGSLKCIGNVAIADRKVAFNQQINGIETLDNNVFFMFEQFNLSQAYIQSTINMALKGILSKSQLSELEFIFPSIELQNEFANFFKKVDKLKLEMENSLKDLEDNFNSLMQKAFKGELF
ncbi:MAG: restriction endonuclease subunit S [Paeniclostridium sordellii]|nr:restriction endonuclease subunit S [Paeniclostridium sordellii]